MNDSQVCTYSLHLGYINYSGGFVNRIHLKIEHSLLLLCIITICSPLIIGANQSPQKSFLQKSIFWFKQHKFVGYGLVAAGIVVAAAIPLGHFLKKSSATSSQVAPSEIVRVEQSEEALFAHAMKAPLPELILRNLIESSTNLIELDHNISN